MLTAFAIRNLDYSSYAKIDGHARSPYYYRSGGGSTNKDGVRHVLGCRDSSVGFGVYRIKVEGLGGFMV